MISIAEIFDNSKELLDSISGFVDKYIGTELLRKCHITKVPEAPRSFKIPGNRKDWVCFICTDTSLSEEDVLRYYTLRWKIELYFHMAKSYLKLRTECHSTSYDAITSHMVIVAIRYMILELARFHNGDRHYGSCRYVLIDDYTGECYCFANTLAGIRNKEKAETNSQQIISLEEYRMIFGRDF